MIDRPDQVGRLTEQLDAALPFPARATPELQATLREQRGVALPADCRVTRVSYTGEEGGIVFKLEATSDLAEAVFASITHLRFDPRLPLARDIAALQKHRAKRLRCQLA